MKRAVMLAITTRPVAPGDEAFLLGLYASTRPELAVLGLDERAMAVLMQMQYRARQRAYQQQYPQALASIILDADGVAVGGMLVARGAQETALVDIGLLPRYRRRGIGTQLLRSLMDECGQRQLPLRLAVACDNPAIGLYRRLGFAARALDGLHVCMQWTAAQRDGVLL